AYTGVSELTFTPTRPFDFDTTYKVDLLAVETRDGVLDAPKSAPWSYSFKTPSFAFLGWTPGDLDLANNTATMEIAFSGAVLKNVARLAMALTVDGKAIASVQILPSYVPSVVAVQLKDPRIKLGAKLGLAIKKGVAAVNGAKAAAATAEF